MKQNKIKAKYNNLCNKCLIKDECKEACDWIIKLLDPK